MEEFIKQNSEKLLVYKKNIFKPKHAYEFIEKLCKRDNLKQIESELTKCLINASVKSDSAIQERKHFIEDFLSSLVILRENINKKEESKRTTDSSSTNTKDSKQKEFEWKPNLKFDNQNFPSLESHELISRKKKYVVLDHHYANKLDKGTHNCYCMSQRHPLVGNCLNCGRIHCLQEGDNVCINCGHKLMTKEKYMSSIVQDNAAKSAFGHKEKLLKFQKDFYSKLQIVDDFTDWYEVSNNTWLSQDNREYARKKDEALEVSEKLF